MKKILLTLSVGAMTLSACGGAPQMMMAPRGPVGPMPAQFMARNVDAELNAGQEKTETPLIADRQVQVSRTPFDDIADQNKGREYAQDPLYAAPEAPAAARSPFNNRLPFQSWSDLRNHLRYGYSTVYEDRKYMDEYYARNHFNRYLNSAYAEVQRLYDSSRSEMKRFITLDVLANSLEVNGRRLPYEDVHNPPAERHYKLMPNRAAELMPTFGEMVSYNRNSYDVNYVRWDMYRAARYYQANYRRIYGLIMEYGPSKRDAKKMVHREISSYAGR